MATISKLEDLQVWVKARLLCYEINELIAKKPFCKDYSLRDQINRSSGSIMDNIAEGFGRGGNPEFIQFLMIAHGSLQETKSQLFRALDRSYLLTKEFDSLYNKVEEISKMIFGLSNYLRSTTMRGQKFVRNKNSEAD